MGAVSQVGNEFRNSEANRSYTMLCLSVSVRSNGLQETDDTSLGSLLKTVKGSTCMPRVKIYIEMEASVF